MNKILKNYRDFRTRIVLIFFISILIIIQGCATKSISENHRFSSDSSKGLLFGSITYDGYYAKYSLYLRNMKTGETDMISAGGSATPFHLFNPEGNLDHLGVKGDLFAIELDPGEYEVFNWQVAPGNGVFLSSPRPFRMKIDIQPGRVLYFGSVNFKQTESFGMSINGAEALYKSQYERDLKELNRNYRYVTFPSISTTVYEGRVLSLGSDTKSSTSILIDAISTGLSTPVP